MLTAGYLSISNLCSCSLDRDCALEECPCSACASPSRSFRSLGIWTPGHGRSLVKMRGFPTVPSVQPSAPLHERLHLRTPARTLPLWVESLLYRFGGPAGKSPSKLQGTPKSPLPARFSFSNQRLTMATRAAAIFVFISSLCLSLSSFLFDLWKQSKRISQGRIFVASSSRRRSPSSRLLVDEKKRCVLCYL